MDKRSTSIIVGVTALAVAFALFIFLSSLFSQNDTQEPLAPQKTPASQERPQTVLTAKHAYRDGVHTVVGEFELPTPCHILETVARVSEDGKNVVIDYTVTSRDETLCAQVITPTRYRVQFTAAPDARIGAQINGAPAVLNIIEAGPNEDLENFELYIKG